MARFVERRPVAGSARVPSPGQATLERVETLCSPTLGREALVACALHTLLWLVAGPAGSAAAALPWLLVGGAIGALPWAAGMERERLRIMGGGYLLLNACCLLLLGLLWSKGAWDLDMVRASLRAMSEAGVLSVLALLLYPVWLSGVWSVLRAPRAGRARELARVLTIALPGALPAALLGGWLGREVLPSAPGAGWSGPLPLIDPSLAGAFSGAAAGLLGACLLRLRLRPDEGLP